MKELCVESSSYLGLVEGGVEECQKQNRQSQGNQANY